MKTVQVRVLLGVNPDGTYAASGGNTAHISESDHAEFVANETFDGAATFWLTAEVPVPDADRPEIVAAVEPVADNETAGA